MSEGAVLDYLVVAVVIGATVFLLFRFFKQTFGKSSKKGCSGCSKLKDCPTPDALRPKENCPSQE